MRVVVDTNVFVSAILKTTSIPALVIRLVQRRGTLLKSRATEEEVREVVARPHLARYMGASVSAWLNEVFGLAELVETTERITVCRDPRDDKFLELAVAGRADLIVSGDADLLAIGSFREIPIIAPSTFVNVIHGSG